MSSQFAVPEVPTQNSPIPNRGFFGWIRSQTGLFISQVLALLGFTFWIAEQTYNFLVNGSKSVGLIDSNVIRLIIDYSNLVFVALFVGYMIKILDDNDHGENRVNLVFRRLFGRQEWFRHFGLKNSQIHINHLDHCKKRLSNFKKYFLYLWISFFVLYAFFAFQHSYKYSHPYDDKKTFIRTHPHNALSMNFIVSQTDWYDSHRPKSIRWQTEILYFPKLLLAVSETEIKFDWINKFVFPGLVLVGNTFTVFFLFCCFLELSCLIRIGNLGNKPSTQENERRKVEHQLRLFRRNFLVFLGSMAALFVIIGYLILSTATHHLWQNLFSVFNTLSGITSCIVMSLMVARLESKLLGLRLGLITALYSYAAIQSLYALFGLTGFELQPTIESMVLAVAFIFKVYFFFIIAYAMQTGRMLNYFFSYPYLKNLITAEAIKAKTSRVAKNEKLFVLGIASVLLLVVNVVLLILFFFHELSFFNVVVVVVVAGLFIGIIVNSFKYSRLKLESERLRGAFERCGKIHLLGVGSFLFFWFILYLFIFFSPDYLRTINFILLILTVIVCLYCVIKSREQYDRSKKYISEAKNNIDPAEYIFFVPSSDLITLLSEHSTNFTKKFYNYFFLFWLANIFLYCCYLFEYTIFGVAENKGIIQFVLVLLQMFFSLSASIFLLISVLTIKNLVPSLGAVSDYKKTVNYTYFLGSLFFCLIVSIFFLSGFSFGSNKDILVYKSFVLVISGLVNAVILTLLGTRMASSWISHSLLTGLVIFFYASLQPLYMVFGNVENGEIFLKLGTAVITSAILLKISLLLIIISFWKTKNITIYLHNFPVLSYLVDSVFSNPFEIRRIKLSDGKFTIAIYRHGELFYSTEMIFKNSMDCDLKVDKICKAIEHLEEEYLYNDFKSDPNAEATASFEDRKERGAMWLNLKIVIPETKEHIEFESVLLRSKREIDRIKDESLMMIPFCRYSR